jgi:hypothetical protein
MTQPPSASATESRFTFSPFTALLRSGFGRLQELIESEEMTFVVNGENFVVPLADALLLSSKVSENVRNDLNSRSFVICTDCATSTDFGEFLSFVHCSSVDSLDSSRGLSFLLFCNLLGNDDLSLLLLSLLHPIDIDIDIDIGIGVNIDVHIDVDMCASHFHLYSLKELQMLDHSLLHRILACPSLSLESEDCFLKMIVELGEDFVSLLNYVEIQYLSGSGVELFFDYVGFGSLTPILWDRICNRLKDSTISETDLSSFSRFKTCLSSIKPIKSNQSTILHEFPSLLSQFREKKWTLVYRGSREGFGASTFHSKCDGQSNTLTIILSTSGCIFGGFTPIAWDCCGNYKSDSTTQSFLFLIKDSRNGSPRIFPIKNVSIAIYCRSSYGPTFGNGHDIHVSDSCNQNASSYTRLGYGYTNDTGIAENQVFTGERHFTVKEIEVFSISS